MSRGYWTYHRTYGTGCCGGPGCCVIAMLAIPLIPVLNGYSLIKDRLPNKEEVRVVEEVKEDSRVNEEFLS